jgi:hypothetical protein
MEMEPEPEIGRVGYETTISLFWTDLISLKDDLSYALTIA